jgi:hypothetical protein
VSPERLRGHEPFVGVTRDPTRSRVLARALGGGSVKVLSDWWRRRLLVTAAEGGAKLDDREGSAVAWAHGDGIRPTTGGW